MMLRPIILLASVLTLSCSLALAADEPEEGGADAEGAEATAPAVPPWPEVPAVEPDQQPYILMRALRAVQDQVAVGSTSAHEEQRRILRDLGSKLRGLPVQVWDDVRNVRSAVFFALSGGDPAVLKVIIDRTTTPHVERRLLRGALAYGEGRQRDALGLLQPLKARDLDPVLGGMVALIQGTLVARTNPKEAIQRLDEARLLAPGTLIEESALRQEILLVAREGELERFDLLRQTAVFRQTEDIVQPESVTQIQNLRGAIVTVGAQQDLGIGPMPADLPDQPANMGGTLGALGPPGRAQQRPDRPTVPVKDDNGLEAVFVIECIEQAQLLMAMHRIEGIVDVEHDLTGRTRKGLAVEPDHLLAHPDQGACIGQVFHARDRGLRTQGCPGFGITLQRELEAGVMTQDGRVVAVLISGGNHHDPEADDVAQAVLHLGRITRVHHASGKPLCQSCFALDLAQQGQTGVGTHVRAVKAKQHRLTIQG